MQMIKLFWAALSLTFTYGLNINMEYKDFDLTLFFQGVQGNDIFNQKKYTYYFDYSNNVVKEAMNGWTKTNRNTGIPIMKTQNTKWRKFPAE